MKRIVLYYSLTNNTREAAEMIAEKLGAELVEIETKKPIPESQGKRFFIGGMQASFGMKPKLSECKVNLSEYDEIILGTPIWAGKNAPAINTLLADKRVRDKVTDVFTFSGGGDNDKCIEILKKKLPALRHEVALADRKHVSARDNDAKIEKFVEEILRG